jgi:hypothetical protein
MKTSVPLMVQWQSENAAVAQFFGEGLWRWRMQEKSFTGEAKVFDAWMRRTVGFLAMGSTRKKSIEIVMRENVVDVRDKSVVRVLCRDASGALDDRVERGLELVDELGVSRSLNLTKTSGGWRSVLPSVIEGTYLLKANCKSMKAVDEKRFVVVNQPSELLNTQANHDVLRDVSNRTGGAFLTLNRSDELNELMRQSSASQHLHSRIDDATRSVSESRADLSRREEQLGREMRELITRIRSAEVEFESRLNEVETRFAAKYEKLLAENLANGRGWVTPFWLLGALALALALLNGLTYYKASKKSRLD